MDTSCFDLGSLSSLTALVVDITIPLQFANQTLSIWMAKTKIYALYRNNLVELNLRSNCHRPLAQQIHGCTCHIRDVPLNMALYHWNVCHKAFKFMMGADTLLSNSSLPLNFSIRQSKADLASQIFSSSSLLQAQQSHSQSRKERISKGVQTGSRRNHRLLLQWKNESAKPDPLCSTKCWCWKAEMGSTAMLLLPS